MLKVVIKKVGQKAQLMELDVDKNNGFMIKARFNKVLESKYNELDKMCIDRESGLYLFVAELGEGANFNISTNNPYFPIQTIYGNAILIRYIVDNEGFSYYEDMTENELELMNCLVIGDDIKAIEYIEISRKNISNKCV